MSVELWFAYAIACMALLAVPGPTVTLVVGYALGNGRSAGWATIPGVAMGHLTAMTVSLAGAGMVLSAPEALTVALQFAVAAYLIRRGVKSLRMARLPKVETFANTGRNGSGAMFRSTFVVTALNPTCVAFFVAILPEFVLLEQPRLPQVTLLVVTFLVLAAANSALWALLAGEARARFTGPNLMPIANGIGGGILIAAGCLTLAARLP